MANLKDLLKLSYAELDRRVKILEKNKKAAKTDAVRKKILAEMKPYFIAKNLIKKKGK